MAEGELLCVVDEQEGANRVQSPGVSSTRWVKGGPKLPAGPDGRRRGVVDCKHTQRFTDWIRTTGRFGPSWPRGWPPLLSIMLFHALHHTVQPLHAWCRQGAAG